MSANAPAPPLVSAGASRSAGPWARAAVDDGPPGGGRPGRRRLTGYAFVAAYAVVLLLLGVVPTGYAIFLSLTTWNGRWAGLGNFSATGRDFRFSGAFEHIAIYLVIWLVVLVVLVPFLALMLQGGIRRAAPVLRFLFYLPGAFIGSASVLVWLLVLDPAVSPWHVVLSWLHFSTLAEVVQPGHLPVVFAAIAFWTGAGTWIVVLHAALEDLPDDVVDAARVDGASAWQLALRVKLPLVKRWLVYMVILGFAAGTQLFVEPQLVGEASGGLVSSTWSPNELAYYFAFDDGNFNRAAAISVDLLVIGIILAAVLVARSKLFEIESASEGLADASVQRAPRRARTRAEIERAGTPPGTSSRRARIRRNLTLVGWLLTMLAFAAFFVVPMIWVVLEAIGFGSFSFARSWQAIYGFQDHELLTWLANSARYSIGGLVLSVGCAVLAGYGLALTQFAGRKVLLGITLVAMIVPASALVLPLFLEMNAVHLVGSGWSVALPFGFFPFGVYLSYLFFSTAFPRQVLDAARIDGAGEWQVFRRIALPMARPVVFLVGFLAFVSNWTNFFLPFTMLYDDKQYPLPVALEVLLSSVPRPSFAMATLVAVAPVVVVFAVAHQGLVRRGRGRGARG